MKKGFTLIELLVVVAIISLLSTIVIAALSDSRNEAKEKKYAVESLDTIRGLNICGWFGRDDDGCKASELTCSELGWDLNASYHLETHNIAYESCGESDFGGSCFGVGLSWEESNEKCESIGARLCTVEELENNITATTGCGYDVYMAWSMSPCEGGMYINEGNENNSSGYQKYCQTDLNNGIAEGGKYPNKNIATRCCADE